MEFSKVSSGFSCEISELVKYMSKFKKMLSFFDGVDFIITY